MLRTLVLAFALAVPGVALADEARTSFPRAAMDTEVRTDDGTVVGRVNAVERDGQGRIVAVEIEGNEPADAPYAPALIAEARSDGRVSLVNDRRQQREPSSTRGTRAR
jgi:hypothetical protein